MKNSKTGPGISGWDRFYKKEREMTYPSEFVLRTFLGAYPNMKHMDKADYPGTKILDLSCGDGRNLAFLARLGFDVYASEISETIVERLAGRFDNVTFGVGYAHNLPFESEFFDYVLARATCYYLERGVSLQDNLREISRIIHPDGIFVGLVPCPGNFLLEGAERLPDNSVIVRKDPFGLRNGCRIQDALSKEHLVQMMSDRFKDICLATCLDDWFGLKSYTYNFVCRRK